MEGCPPVNRRPRLQCLQSCKYRQLSGWCLFLNIYCGLARINDFSWSWKFGRGVRGSTLLRDQLSRHCLYTALSSTSSPPANSIKLGQPAQIPSVYFHASNWWFYLIPWLIEPESSTPHSQVLSNKSYPEPNQSNSSY